MNKETIMQHTIMQYLNKLIKVELAQNKEVPYIHGTYIGVFQYDEKFNIYSLNHAYNTDKKSVDAGDAAFDVNDIIGIGVPTDNESKTWLEEYIKFSNSVIKEKGSDACDIGIHSYEDFKKFLIQ